MNLDWVLERVVPGDWEKSYADIQVVDLKEKVLKIIYVEQKEIGRVLGRRATMVSTMTLTRSEIWPLAHVRLLHQNPPAAFQ